MLGSFLRRITALPALAVFLVQVGLMHRAMMGHTGGQPSYPVDDAFIHLSLARHIVETGVLGVVPHVFASTSSSIAWPWLLALAMRVFGNDAWLPLWMNVAFGACVPFAVDLVARRLGGANLGAIRRAVLGVFVVVLAPLPTLALVGMEHTLHVLAMIAFVAAAAMHVEDTRRMRRLVLVLAAVAVSARYESLFAIGAAVGLLALRKKWIDAARLAFAGALPVVSFGIYSKLHGSYFLPVSVLLKGRPLEIKDATDAVDLFGGDLLDHLSHEAHLFVLLIASSWLLVWCAKHRGLFAARTAALAIVVVNLLAHIELAGLGWFYRYDSYLVATLVLVVFVVAWTEAPKTTWARMKTLPYWLVLAAGALTFGPMLPRVIAAAKDTPAAGGNIFDQQVQTARFLERYFPRDLAAINDIGAVTYYRDGPIVDLVGLADVEVAKAKHMKLDKPLRPDDVVRFTKDARVAVLYDDWFHDLVPKDWFLVARWTIPGNVSCAFPTVSIYAIHPDDVAPVVAAVRAYEADGLPAEVARKGYASAPFGSIAAGDAVELDVDSGAAETRAFVVGDDDTVDVEHIGVAVLRGAKDGDVVAVGRAAHARVRLVHRHAPRVCVLGAVRLPRCLEAASATDAIAAADPLPSARLGEAYGLRDGEAGLSRVTREVLDAGIVDRDVVVVP